MFLNSNSNILWSCLVFFLLTMTSHHVYSQNNPMQLIQSDQAKQHIGSYKIVCGEIAQVKSFAYGVYLNMGQVYPDQDLTAVVWSHDVKNFGNLYRFKQQVLCIEGKIERYQNKPQIQLKTFRQIITD